MDEKFHKFAPASRADGRILVGRSGHVGLILLNRPKKGNAFDEPMLAALDTAWPELDNDPDVRVIILSSTQDRLFCTGKDVTELSAEVQPWANQSIDRTPSLTPRDAHIWTPVICAIEGLVVGGGLHFVMDSDIIIASENAAFMDTHVDVGLAATMEGIGLAQRIGIGNALHLFLRGRRARIDARRALALGLVQEVVAPGETFDRALELAEEIGQGSPTAVSRTLQAIWSLATIGGYEQARQYAGLLAQRQTDHPDSKEGPHAWLEKRLPRWQGKHGV